MVKEENEKKKGRLWVLLGFTRSGEDWRMIGLYGKGYG